MGAMTNQPRFASVTLSFVVAILIALSAQDRPVFRSEVEYIEIDARVTDEDGNQVRGLTRDDFTLLEDGVPQAIATFSVVDLPTEVPLSRAGRAAAVESDIATNSGEGRTYVVLISVFRGQLAEPTRLVARRFVEEVLRPNDQMAVIHVLDNMSKAQGVTRSRSLILASIDRTAESTYLGDEMTMSYQVLEQVSERVARMNGRRKAVVWFNPPSFFQPDDVPGATDHVGAMRWFALRDAVRAATRNNVAIYAVTPGMSTSLGMESLKTLGAMRALAEDTGGEAIVNTNNFSPGFERLVRDSSTYYLLGYAPTVEHRDGKFHDIAVRVNRPGVTIRARRGYYAPEPETRARPAAGIVEGLSADTIEALRMPSSVDGLGIDLFAAPFKGDDGRGSVVLGADLRGADLALGSADRIEIAYQATTTEGRLTPGAFKVFTFDFTPESRAVIEQTGLRIVERLALPRGRHQVRFVVSQPNGKTGSVVADVEIPDYNAPLAMSGIVIGSQVLTPRRTLSSDSSLKTVLSSEPTTVRRFGRQDVLTAFAEVYWDPRSRPDDLRVVASVATADGGAARRPSVSAVPGERGRLG
jgi:Ca-activated chloride channel family protein